MELMLLGRPPSPSSASSSGSDLVFTHTGKYFSFSWGRMRADGVLVSGVWTRNHPNQNPSRRPKSVVNLQALPPSSRG